MNRNQFQITKMWQNEKKHTHYLLITYSYVRHLLKSTDLSDSNGNINNGKYLRIMASTYMTISLPTIRLRDP